MPRLGQRQLHMIGSKPGDMGAKPDYNNKQECHEEDASLDDDPDEYHADASVDDALEFDLTVWSRRRSSSRSPSLTTPALVDSIMSTSSPRPQATPPTTLDLATQMAPTTLSMTPSCGTTPTTISTVYPSSISRLSSGSPQRTPRPSEGSNWRAIPPIPRGHLTTMISAMLATTRP